MEKWLQTFRHTIWVYPAIYSLVSFMAAIVVIFMDQGMVSLEAYVPAFLFTKVDLAQTILTVVAGSLMTMITFTFSTTMVVLTTYASQFSPRTVENFLMDHKTMQSLGVFTGGFVYTITSLLFLHNDLGNKGLLTSFITTIYSIVCLVVFIQYIQHVSQYIQTNNLIARLADSTATQLRQYKERLQKGSIVQQVPFEEEEPVQSYTVMAGHTGYLQWIDYAGLEALGREEGVSFYLRMPISAFVSAHQPLVTIYDKKEIVKKDEAKDDTWEERLRDKVQEHIFIAQTRSEAEDFEFSLQKISEIATRALSPGTNDPNTAVHCLRMMGPLLREAAMLPKGILWMPAGDEQESSQGVYYTMRSFEDMLFEAYQPIIHYGKGDFATMRAAMQSLVHMMNDKSYVQEQTIDNFLQYIWRKMADELKSGLEGQRLLRIKESIENSFEEVSKEDTEVEKEKALQY